MAIDTNNMVYSAQMTCGRDWFDDEFIDNNLMVKALVSTGLTPDGDSTIWIVAGVHVAAKKSPSSTAKTLKYRYEFVGSSWRMDFDAVFDRDLKLNNKRSIIKWVADHGEQRGDKGATARSELHKWLCSLPI